VASSSVLIKPSAARELEGLELQDRRLVVERIRSLADDPGPRGCEKLSGKQKYRIRHGDVRVLYEIADANSTVTIVKIGHRRDVYR
jgi:mRNA interferase RelE/StbE